MSQYSTLVLNCVVEEKYFREWVQFFINLHLRFKESVTLSIC